REALVALIDATLRPFQVDPKRGPSDAVGAIADAILAAGWTPRGEGTTIEIGGSRAGKTQALAERVADEVMKRGGSATVTSLPSVEALADALAAEGIDADPGDPDLTPTAERLLAMLPGRTEAEVKAEALREAASAAVTDDEGV